MVRLVLFDIDGTLLHTGGVGIRAFGRVLATRFNLPDRTDHIKFSGRTDVSLVREVFRQYGVAETPANFEFFFECYVHWLDHFIARAHGEACPGVLPFIEALKKLPQAPTMGLLTGNIRLGAEIKLRRFDLWEVFETGAFADDHEDRNMIARVAIERGARVHGRKLHGEEVLVIGDTPLDVECGRAIGAKVLAVATGGASLGELKMHRPDWAVSSLHEVNAYELVHG